MTKLSIFGGTGFIGSRFMQLYPNNILMDRGAKEAETNKILYLISTVDNYNMFTDPYIDIETNLNHLIDVLESNRNKYDSKFEFNFISSFFVYGNNTLPFREDMLCNPMGFYSVTKYAAERLIQTYCQSYNIPHRIIRLANVYGKGDKFSKKKNAFQFLLEKVKNNEDVHLYENGLFLRDMIYLDETCDGINFIINSDIRNEIFNLGTGNPVQFKGLLEYAKRLTGSTSNLLNMPVPEFHRIVGIRDAYLNVEKVKHMGWKTIIDAYRGVEKLLE